MKAYTAQLKRPTAERDRLISEHIEIARRISMRMARRCPDWIAREDLVAAGMLGLTEAAERYDSTRNEPFLAFAEKRIRGAVLDELRRGDIMPRRARQMARKIGATIQELERKTGKSPSDEDVAAALGVTLEAYRTDLEHLVHVTVGAFDHDDDGSGALATSETSPEAGAARGQALSRVRTALPRLDPRDILVLGLYYNEELTYHEIAQVLGVTTSRVCQLHGRAISRLRAEIETAPAQEAPRVSAAAAAAAAAGAP
ncbi:MAG TPA: RNA polymerase sigma factor FliA [Kofleriaceae bacterium]|nr:RNA polymerase sigma factor FliA [Kofleriaceae bacterium]